MGVGFNSILVTFDPTTMDKWRTVHPSEVLVPTQADLSSPTTQRLTSALFQSIVSRIDMAKVSETAILFFSVQRYHLDNLVPHLNGRLVTTTVTKQSLASLDCAIGNASAASVPDGFFIDKASRPRGICDAKDNVRAPADKGRQGIAEASNLAFTQVRLGVATEDVMIPIMSTTGYLVQFTVMVLLKPFFPTVFHISKVLDLSDSVDRGLAAGHLAKILDFVSQPLPTNRPPPSPAELSELGLSAELYYVKPIANFFRTREDVHSSALYFLHVMSTLHRDLECREFVVFPYCFGQWKENYGIVFPNLKGYRIGLPAEPSLRDAFLTAGERNFNCTLLTVCNYANLTYHCFCGAQSRRPWMPCIEPVLCIWIGSYRTSCGSTSRSPESYL